MFELCVLQVSGVMGEGGRVESVITPVLMAITLA